MRGISPIVSTILMVAIAIAAAVVVYYITMDVVTQQGAQLQEQATAGQEKIVIEAINVSTDDTTKIYLRNLGDTTVEISAIYAIASDGSVAATVDGLSNVKIDPNSVGTITINPSTSTTNPKWSADLSGEYYIKIVTKNGTTTMSQKVKFQ